MEMYCRQCEQTAKGENCYKNGVCGKSPEVSSIQDYITYVLIGLAVAGIKTRDMNADTSAADKLILEGLFSTVTNVNFDEYRLFDLVNQINKEKELLIKNNKLEFIDSEQPVINRKSAETINGLIEENKVMGKIGFIENDEDKRSLKELVLYGLRGMAAYAHHAYILGKTDSAVMDMFYKGLYAINNNDISSDKLLELTMEIGKANLTCMEILDCAHTETFGNPEPASVDWGTKTGPAIIVSGHDLLDLKQLLEQTENEEVNIYTHGEMLPAHGYPELKKYKNLAGHFGTAWQNQQKEFENIPAVILMTTNCIQKPHKSYKDRIFTTGLVAWPEVEHIASENPGKKNFSAIIKKAKELGGFKETSIKRKVMTGFGHNAVLSVADKIVEAVKSKAIKHFFLIGGCDGAKPGRNYYTDLAKSVPEDSVILTLACGKFRFNNLNFGTIGDIPRLLDIGQCNDAYSAIKIATALADAFNCGVNELPLSLILSWYEQKAVVILLTLLSLGIKNIRIGPSLPAFISNNILTQLVENFKLKPVSTPEEDLNEILAL